MAKKILFVIFTLAFIGLIVSQAIAIGYLASAIEYTNELLDSIGSLSTEVEMYKNSLNQAVSSVCIVVFAMIFEVGTYFSICFLLLRSKTPNVNNHKVINSQAAKIVEAKEYGDDYFEEK